MRLIVGGSLVETSEGSVEAKPGELITDIFVHRLRADPLVFVPILHLCLAVGWRVHFRGYTGIAWNETTTQFEWNETTHQ